MKITESLQKYENQELISVIDKKYLGNYTFQIEFSNGIEKFVDFESFLKKSNHESIKKYLDKKLFERVDIINGNLNWNDYDMIFPVNDLYTNNI